MFPELLPQLAVASGADGVIDVFDALGGAGLSQPGITCDGCHPVDAGYVEVASVRRWQWCPAGGGRGVGGGRMGRSDAMSRIGGHALLPASRSVCSPSLPAASLTGVPLPHSRTPQTIYKYLTTHVLDESGRVRA